MGSVFSSLAAFNSHFWLAALVFLLVGTGVIFILSGGKLRESLFGIARAGLTFFSTPFVFLRNALTILRGASEAEKDYQRSRVFMLYRYNRLQYLGVLLVSILVLTGGVTSALFSLIPEQELQMQRSLAQQQEQLSAALTQAQDAVKQAASPERLEQLKKTRDDLQKTLETQRAQNAELQRTGFNGPIVVQIAAARSVESVSRITSQIDVYMSGCPGGYDWPEFTAEGCAQARAFVAQFAAKRTAELNTEKALQEANQTLSTSTEGGELAKAQVTEIENALQQNREQQGRISLFNPSVIGEKLGGALWILLGAVLVVMVLIWIWAILIDIVNWLLLMMRVTEKDAMSKLPNSDREFGGEPPAS